MPSIAIDNKNVAASSGAKRADAGLSFVDAALTVDAAR